MKLKILSWNVRGANDGAKRKVIKSFVKMRRVDVVCLQETKLKEVSKRMIRELGAGRFLEWVAVNADGASGGILIFWDTRVIQLLEKEEDRYTLSCRFKSLEEDFVWVFTGVYGPTVYARREDFWDELGAIRGLWGDPWCVGGDFNVIRDPMERNRASRFNHSMRRFSQVTDELELKDFPMQGGLFTWRGGPNNGRMARLDRFLITEEWECQFGKVIQSILPRPISDHAPILLEGGTWLNGPSPFRFENMWLKVEGFKELIRDWWQSFEFRGTHSYVLVEKMKALKAKIKEWNKEVFGCVDEQKKFALNKVAHWDELESRRTLSDGESKDRVEAMEEFKKWATLEEISWRQKSREIWLKEGDRNTDFFHKMANSHRKRSNIDRIRIGDKFFNGTEEVKVGIVKAVKDLFRDHGGWRASPEGLNFSRLNALEVVRLEAPFTEEEVHGALADLNGDKAPGPDGFTVAFWQFGWDVVKSDILGCLEIFMIMGDLLEV